jgi:hypothetical protein
MSAFEIGFGIALGFMVAPLAFYLVMMVFAGVISIVSSIFGGRR